MARWVCCRDIFWPRTRNRRLPRTRVPPATVADAAVRAVAAVLAKVGDAVVRAADAAHARVDAAPAKVDEAPAKVGVARARAEEAHGKADAALVREASRHVIPRHPNSA